MGKPVVLYLALKAAILLSEPYVAGQVLHCFALR